MIHNFINLHENMQMESSEEFSYLEIDWLLDGKEDEVKYVIRKNKRYTLTEYKTEINSLKDECKGNWSKSVDAVYGDEIVGIGWKYVFTSVCCQGPEWELYADSSNIPKFTCRISRDKRDFEISYGDVYTHHIRFSGYTLVDGDVKEFGDHKCDYIGFTSSDYKLRLIIRRYGDKIHFETDGDLIIIKSKDCEAMIKEFVDLFDQDLI